MSEKYLHVVAFDIPVPVNYGGAIDIYYKLKFLHQEGVKIHLHCYQYGRDEAPELTEFCHKVTYYKRQISKTKLFLRKPYIVVTRSSPELFDNLLKDEYPILFEGLHTCYFLNDSRLKNRRKIVRTHNVEHDYYASLAHVERNLFKRYYFLNESSKLERFEPVLRVADGIAAISTLDLEHFKKINSNVVRVSAFHPFEKVQSKTGKGTYVLYHGSLEVGENNRAALFLVNEIFNNLDIPLVIAGNKPTQELKEAVAGKSHIRLACNLTTEHIYDLVANAHINLLPTFQATGIKLKLLAALFNGRFCLVNPPMVENTGLEELCTIANDVERIKEEIHRLFTMEFTDEMKMLRNEILIESGFTNQYNITKLLELLYP